MSDDNVRARRTASVTISGSSNLPPDKLGTLSTSFNKVLQLVVDMYNACEDSNISTNEKLGKFSAIIAMQKDVDELIYCLGEEMNICSEPIRQGLRPKFSDASQNAKQLKYLIHQYSGETPIRIQTVRAIFDELYQLVNNSVDLLKLADKHFVERLVNEANLTLNYLKFVREAASVNDLVVATMDFSTASVNLVKRFSKRIDSGVLSPEYKGKATHALEVLRTECANVVTIKRNTILSPQNQSHAVELDGSVQTIVNAIKTVLEVAQSEPRFSVDFQVDYVDDEFGLLLSKLHDAVDEGNSTLVVSLLQKIIRETSSRVVDSGFSQDDPRVKLVKNYLQDTRDLSQHKLKLIQTSVSPLMVTEATTNLTNATKKLRESYNSLTNNQYVDRTNMRIAARQIVAHLEKLI